MLLPLLSLITLTAAFTMDHRSTATSTTTTFQPTKTALSLLPWRTTRSPRRSSPPLDEMMFCGMVAPDNSSSMESASKSTSWKDSVLQLSNWASMLCVLDCTILPIITILFPLLGWMTPNLHGVHQLGHQVALFFVTPVGLLATSTNYAWNHKSVPIAMLGLLGVIMVVAANAPHAWLHATTGMLHEVLHAAHHGVMHRVTNLLGCACLLGSNFLSRRAGHVGDCCSKKHH